MLVPDDDWEVGEPVLLVIKAEELEEELEIVFAAEEVEVVEYADEVVVK